MWCSQLRASKFLHYASAVTGLMFSSCMKGPGLKGLRESCSVRVP